MVDMLTDNCCISTYDFFSRRNFVASMEFAYGDQMVNKKVGTQIFRNVSQSYHVLQVSIAFNMLLG